MRLQGRVAIVTGGGTGIGKAIALAFAQEGASVAICGKREQPLQQTVQEISSRNGSAIYESVDITNPKQIKQFIENVVKIYGTLDFLVNSAGIATSGTLLDVTDYEWDDVFSVDLKGVMHMAKEVLPFMIKKHYGKIINIASIAGCVGFTNSAAYCSAKGALISLTRQMALDFAGQNITVNAIAPGFIETDMTKDYLQDEVARQHMLNNTPLGRIGQPEDIACATVFLASAGADFITGQTLVIDGGWTIH